MILQVITDIITYNKIGDIKMKNEPSFIANIVKSKMYKYKFYKQFRKQNIEEYRNIVNNNCIVINRYKLLDVIINPANLGYEDVTIDMSFHSTLENALNYGEIKHKEILIDCQNLSQKDILKKYIGDYV